MKHTLIITAVLASLTLPATAEARVKLQDDRAIEDGLVLVAAGNLLRKTCDDISPRIVAAYSYAKSLEKRAKTLGYSRSEIDAYMDSDPDKARVKAKARKWLEARGAKMSDTKSICAVGRAEIKNNSPLGALLRAR